MKAINPHAGESGDEQEMRQGFPCVLLVYPPSFRMGKSYPEVIPSIPPRARVLTLVCRWIYWGTSSYEEPCSIHALFGLCPPQADFCLRRNNGWTIPFFEITYSILDCGAEYAPQGTEKWGISKDIRILISFFRREVRNKRCDHRATHQYLLL